jgi:putative membrane protein
MTWQLSTQAPPSAPESCWTIMWVVWAVIFWTLVTGLVIFLVWHRAASRNPRASAQAILSERFAQGEISETEYRDRLAVLRDS